MPAAPISTWSVDVRDRRTDTMHGQKKHPYDGSPIITVIVHRGKAVLLSISAAAVPAGCPFE